ncbi:MAG: lytic murein transglycosylase, partial [Dissulfurimicrobium sp.]
DLLSKADAIASMANYLKSYGWSPGLNYDDAVQVILKYNYSRPYAETVLQVAERLGLKIGDNSVVAGVPDAASRAF